MSTSLLCGQSLRMLTGAQSNPDLQSRLGLPDLRPIALRSTKLPDPPAPLHHPDLQRVYLRLLQIRTATRPFRTERRSLTNPLVSQKSYVICVCS